MEQEIERFGHFKKDYSWQERAIEYYFLNQSRFYSSSPGEFESAYIVEVSPSGGKTIFSMKLAREMICGGYIDIAVWCVPRDSIKLGFQDDCKKVPPLPEAFRKIKSPYFRVETDLESTYRGALENYHGLVITYQSLNSTLEYLRLLSKHRRIMFIFDEAHHGSTNSPDDDDAANIWGSAMAKCQEFAHSIVCMTGTPLRSDNRKVPFVQYEDVNAYDPTGEYEKTGHRVKPDFSFNYRNAVTAGIARKIIARNNDPEVEYQVDKPDGSVEHHTRLLSTVPRKHLQEVKKTAICFRRGIVDELLKLALEENTLQRKTGDADAAILVIGARDFGESNSLENIAQRIKEISNEKAVTVSTVDGPGAREKIKEFKTSKDRWIVAKEMISEGTNIPRIRSILILRDIGNKTFYEQLVHRATRNDADDRPQDAIIIQLHLPNLVEWASALEEDARIGWEARPKESGGGGGTGGEAEIVYGINAELEDESIIIEGGDFSDVDPIGREIHAEIGAKTKTSRWQIDMILKALPDYADQFSFNVFQGETYTVDEQCQRLRDAAVSLCKAAGKMKGGDPKIYARIIAECKRAAGIKGKLDNVMRDHPRPLEAFKRFYEAAKHIHRRALEQKRGLGNG